MSADLLETTASVWLFQAAMKKQPPLDQAVASLVGMLRDVRNDALEEAAQCADRVAAPSESGRAALGDLQPSLLIAATGIAIAIRGLKGRPL